MSEILYVEGPDHEAICEQLLREYGRNIRLISTERVRRGGVGGFFAREFVGVRFELTDGDSPSIATAAPASSAQSAAPYGDSIDPGPGSAEDPTSSAELTFLAALSASAPAAPAAVRSPAAYASASAGGSLDGGSAALSVLTDLDDEPTPASEAWSAPVLSAAATPARVAPADGPTATAPSATAPSAAALALDALLAARRIAPPVVPTSPSGATAAAELIPPLLAATLAAVPTRAVAVPSPPVSPPPPVTAARPAAPVNRATVVTEAERSGRHSISAGSITLQELIARAELGDTGASRPVSPPSVQTLVEPEAAVPMIATEPIPIKAGTPMEQLIGSLLADHVAPLAVTSPEDPADFVPATFCEIDEAALINPVWATPVRPEMTPEVTSDLLSNGGSEELPSGLSPKVRIEALGELRALGIPIWMTPDAEDKGLYRAIEQVVVELPPAPRPPSRAGALIAVVGPVDAAREAAAVVCAELRVPVEDVWIAGDLTVRHSSRRITGPLDAARCAAELRVGDVPAVVIVATGNPAEAGHGIGWAGQVVAALDPDAVWAVADASRKAEDTRSELAGLGAIDALIVHSAERTISPASVWELDIPVALLDGRPATAGRWAALLFDRLSAHRNVQANSDRDLRKLSSAVSRSI